MYSVISVSSQKSLKQVGLVVSAAAVCVLAGCASKPTYNSASGTGAGVSTQIITDSKGVPNRYQVKQGDTVSRIAQRYNLDWRKIGEINNLNSSYTIYTGQWLTLWTGNISARERAIASVAAVQSITPAPKPVSTPSSTVIEAVVSPSPAPKPMVVIPPVAVTPSVATVAPFATGSSGVMQFRYPVSNTNPVVRRFGTATVAGSTVTSHGMWFSGKEGDAINASNSGTIVQADRNMDGASIVIQHTNGFISSYIHIKDAQVKTGDTVTTGQRIASMKHQAGGSALFEFRITRNGVYVDPLTVLK